jgi:hypothetical protein
MMRASHVSRQIVSAALRVHIVVGILAVVPKAHPAVLAMGLTSRHFVVQEIVVRMNAVELRGSHAVQRSDMDAR